jgi:CRP-like cAMP-binding protein
MSALPKPSEFDDFNDLNGLTPDFGAASFAASANIKRLKAGETLYVEGDAAPFCYQVASGVVKEYNTLEDGRRQVADFYGVGELFGISELSEQLHTAEAVTDCTVRGYPRETFLHAVASSPELSHHFLDTIMTRLHRARERMVMLGRMNAIQRIASFLLRLSEQQETATDIHFPMSRQDIADHLGLTTETVCRALTTLKKKGMVIMPSARVFSIPDEDRLEDVAHGSAGFA